MIRRFVLLVIAASLVGVAPAAATTSLTPGTVAGGQTTDYVFAVTNQTQSPTKKVVITFPESPTIKGVNAQSPSGWTSTVFAQQGPTTGVTYSSGTLAPLATGIFTLTFAAPTVDATMNFMVQQTYADGTTTTADSASLEVDAAAASTTTSEITTTTTQLKAVSTTTTTVAPKKTSGSGRSTLGEFFIVLGVGTAMFLVARWRRTPR